MDFGPVHGPFIKSMDTLTAGDFDLEMVMRREVMPGPSLGCTIPAPSNDNFNLSNLAMMGLLNKHIDEICSEETIERLKARATEVSAMMGVAIAEVYSPWRVNEMCKNM